MIPETDEVKRWRHPGNCDCCAEVEVDTQEQEIARLRALIKDAPHAHLCVSRSGLPCSCWKKDAL